MITIDAAVAYIKSFPDFKKWEDDNLAKMVRTAIFTDSLCYWADTNTKELKGIILSSWHSSCCLNILCMCGDKGCLKIFVEYLKKKYPQVKTLRAERKGKRVTYNVDKL